MASQVAKLASEMSSDIGCLFGLLVSILCIPLEEREKKEKKTKQKQAAGAPRLVAFKVPAAGCSSRLRRFVTAAGGLVFSFHALTVLRSEFLAHLCSVAYREAIGGQMD